MTTSSISCGKLAVVCLLSLIWLTGCGRDELPKPKARTSSASAASFVVASASSAAQAQPSVPAVSTAAAATAKNVVLPPPQTTGGMPLMQALKARRSVREYAPDEVPPQVLSNLLWAAFGVNRPKEKGRTAPSAHDLQEIDIYVVTKKGVWLYEPFEHKLVHLSDKDITALTGKQDFVKDTPLNLVFVSDYAKFTDDPMEYVKFYSATDTGYISQNVYLFCASEGLVTMVRAYIDLPKLSKALRLKPTQHITLAQSVGYPKK